MPDCTYTFIVQLKFNPYLQPSKPDIDKYIKTMLDTFVEHNSNPFDEDFKIEFELLESKLQVSYLKSNNYSNNKEK